jgi:trk system potassium uptake protein TrkA
MHILIVGAGVVGTNLAEQLSREGQEISVVDHNPNLIRKLSEKLDVRTVVGEATSPDILRQAGIERADMLIAVTNVDELNLVLCMLGKKMGVQSCIARMRNQEYTQDEQLLDVKELGVDLQVNPEEIIVKKALQIIDTPLSTEVADFGDGHILLRGFHIEEDAPIAGRRLADLAEASSMDSFLIIGISRKGELIIPTGADIIQPDDTIYVVISDTTLPLFIPFVTKRVSKIERVVIYGATRAGVQLTRKLIERDLKPVLIEDDPERAQAAAHELPKARVMVGDGADQEILLDANIKETDLFIALSEDDELNLLTSLLARSMGAKQLMVQAEDPDYVPIYDGIGLDVVINPRLITVSEILKLVRRGRVQNVFRIHGHDAEVLEIEAGARGPAVGHPLAEVKFPKGAIVCAVMRNNSMMIPNGKTVVQPGEHVVLFALPSAVGKLEKLFGGN